jgi:hypothetical protein
LHSVTLSDIEIERPVGVLLLKNAPRFKAVRAFIETLCGPGTSARPAGRGSRAKKE